MPATAPYNFLPFVAPMTASEINGEDFRLPPHDMWVPGRISGHLDYTVTTLTPLHIGGGSDARSLTITAKDAAGDEREWFWIPGSEIRGMLRSTLEGMLGGGLDRIDPDRLVHYRAPRSEANDYREAYWRARGRSLEDIPDLGAPNDEQSGLLYRATTPSGEYTYTLAPATLGRTLRTTLRGGAPVSAAAVKRIQFQKVGDGYLLYTGRPNDRNRTHAFVIVPTDEDRLPVDNLMITAFTDAHKRANHTRAHFPLFDEYWIRHPDAPIPVFYDAEKDDAGRERVVRIGVAGEFRITAKHSLLDSVPQKVRGGELPAGTPSAVDALFGRVSITASDEEIALTSRVSVGHAFSEFAEDKLLAPHRVRLESPKLMATHMRLVQPHGKLQTFDSPAPRYRGREVYLHRWPPVQVGKGDEQSEEALWAIAASPPKGLPSGDAPEFRPVRSDTTFRGRIDFTNLTTHELGAVLVAIRLQFSPAPQGGGEPTHAHKLGGLKPLGLGSVTLSADLHVLDPASRYSASSFRGFPGGEEELMSSFRARLESAESHREALTNLELATRWSARLDATKTRPMTILEHAQRPKLPTLKELFR